MQALKEMFHDMGRREYLHGPAVNQQVLLGLLRVSDCRERSCRRSTHDHHLHNTYLKNDAKNIDRPLHPHTSLVLPCATGP